MDLRVNNYTNPTFQANVIVDDSYKRLGKFANQEILPKLQDKLSSLGSEDVNVTLKGYLCESDWTGNKIIAEITTALSTITPKLEVFVDRLRPPLFSYTYNDFVTNIKNAIEDL